MTRGFARNGRPVLVGAVAAIAVASLGAWITDLSPWYYGLQQPPWKPPDWLFGPAWTTIFTLTAIAGIRAWRRIRDTAMRRRLMGLFALNGVLNIVWSVLFFRLQRPDWSLKEALALWASIAWLIVAVWPHERAAAALLLPYLAWVTFAAVLNAAVVELNGPFTP